MTTPFENERLIALELSIDSLSARMSKLEKRLTGSMILGGFLGSMLMSAIHNWIG